MKQFNEHDETGLDILDTFEIFLLALSLNFKISFAAPYHDIARRFLNEINEFKPIEEINVL